MEKRFKNRAVPDSWGHLRRWPKAVCTDFLILWTLFCLLDLVVSLSQLRLWRGKDVDRTEHAHCGWWTLDKMFLCVTFWDCSGKEPSHPLLFFSLFSSGNDQTSVVPCVEVEKGWLSIKLQCWRAVSRCCDHSSAEWRGMSVWRQRALQRSF